jgi:hypothetical protein
MKVLPAFLILIVLSLLIDCGTVESTNENEEAIINVGDINYIKAGESRYIEGTIESNIDIDPQNIEISIKDNYMYVIDNENLYIERISSSSGPTINLREDLELKIVSKNTACNGPYFLDISIDQEGIIKSSYQFPFIIKDGHNCDEKALGTFVINVGANENTEIGSSIDFDEGKVYLMSEAASKISEIDLCYAYSGVNNIEKIGTAYWAYKSEYNFAKNWGESAPNIKFYKVSMTKSQFNDIITVEELEDMWDSSLASESSYEVSTGDTFMLETTEKIIALILIEDQETGSTGKITIKVAK